MLAEQLSFLEEVDEKEVRKIIVKELKKYRALKVQLENKKECDDSGANNLFPTLRKQDNFNSLRVKQIERALDKGLDAIEKEIIKKKYLELQIMNDLNIYLEIGLKKDMFYIKKRSAILNLATALGII
jgi:ArpU family phage transcriptional regulator